MNEQEKLTALKSWSQLPVEQFGQSYRFTVFDDPRRRETKMCLTFDEALDFAIGVATGRKLEVAERIAEETLYANYEPKTNFMITISSLRYGELLAAEDDLKQLHESDK